MKRIDASSSIVLILERGEELQASLQEFAATSGVQSAWLSGQGGAMKTTLGYYNLETKSYEWKEFDETLEIVSLTGNLSLSSGQPFWHIHGVFSNRDFQAIGGHVKSMTVGLTGELHITPISPALHRDRHDNITGLKLIS
jgi:predicted DNA-binding protein with PD1-like motif